MTGLDYIIVCGFLAVMALAGLAISRLIKTSDDIFVAGRELTPFILCATITSTNLSMFHIVGMGGIAYQSGASIVWQNWTGDIALVLSGLFVVPIMRRLRIRSVPEFLEMRYGRGLRTLVGAFWGIRLCIYLGILLYIASTAAIIITGSANTPAIYVRWLLTFSVVSILYSAIGGAWAVAIMDSVQFVVMLGGLMILLPIATHAAGGMPAVLEYFRSTGQHEHIALIPTTGEFNWLFVSAIMLLGFKWSTVDQAILQRAFGARTPRISAQGMVLSAIITTPFAFFWIFPGLAAAKMHPGFTNPDNAIPWLLATYVPQVARGLLGVVLCGLIAAQVSAITADINSVATLFTSDVYRTLRRREPSSRHLVFVVRLSSIACGVLMLLVAFYLYGNGAGAVRANLAVVGILDMPLFVITIVYGLLWKRANWQGAVAGFLVGGTLGILTYKVFQHSNQAIRNIVPFVSTATALAVTPIVSLLTQPPSHDVDELWRRFKATEDASDASASASDTERDTFTLIPRSFAGRAGVAMVLSGFAVWVSSVVCAALAFSSASTPLAIVGMLMVFIGGLVRVYSL